MDAVIEGCRISGEPSSIISLINDTSQIIRRGAGDVGLFE
jgi:tRNA A37 threonylcarbamoyladenosine synthetase subunit TsaC/SUA5/YrdC